jgi:hypothetical protein
MQNQGTGTPRESVLIPAEVVDLLRDGLRSQIARAARQIADADGQLGAREHPERYQDPLRCIDASRALLDALDWSAPPSDLHVDLSIHGRALTAALRDQLSVYADMLSQIDRGDEQHEALTRNTSALQALALTVLLGAHALSVSSAQQQIKGDFNAQD